MAPGLVDIPTGTASAFPDGLKTSGQHAPDYNLVKPYSDFPKEITGPTVWQADDYKDSPERWTYSFNERDIDEISTAADRFIQAGTPLTGITKVIPPPSTTVSHTTVLSPLQDQFPLPGLSARMADLRKDLVDGKGFFLFRNLPVQDWDLQKAAVAYMGLGTYLGYFVSQNGRGHVLGHVKDLGEDPTRTDKVRIYRTNARYVSSSSVILIIAQSITTRKKKRILGKKNSNKKNKKDNTSTQTAPTSSASFASQSPNPAASLTSSPRTTSSTSSNARTQT